MAELVDALRSGRSGRKAVEVRLLLSAHFFTLLSKSDASAWQPLDAV